MESREYLKLDHSKNIAKGQVEGIHFEDHGHFVLYLPSLNLSSYGKDMKEAQEMMHIIVEDFFENLLSCDKNVASFELKKLGWKQNKLFKKKFNDPPYVDINGILKDFNLSKDTKVTKELLEV